MPHATPLIATIVAGLCIAFVFGAIANRFKIPPLAGYLLAGIIVGPFTPGYVADQHIAPELAEIGVILLMFGVGLHFSLKDLLAVKRIAVPGALVQIAFATLLGWGAARVFGWSSGAGIVFGLSLSVASTVVLLRALQDLRLLDTDQGRIAVGWLIVEDLVMVLALVLLPPLAGLLGGSDDSTATGHAAQAASTGSLLWTLALTLAKVVAFIAVMLVVGRRVIPWVLSQIVKTGSKELFTLGVLAIALGVAFGSASIFGVSFALGAFFAGMILGESEMSHDAAEDILPLRDAFSVLFFVSVGMLFDFHVLIERPIQVLVTCLIIIVGKSLAALGIVKLFKRSTETAFTIAASLAQIGEFSFILAGLGVSLHLLPESGRDLVLAGAILSIILNPFVFVVARRLTAWGGRSTPIERMAGVPAEMPRDERHGADAAGVANRTASGAGATSIDAVTAVSSDVYAASALGMVSTEWIDDAGVHSGDHAARAASASAAADAQAASNAGRRGVDLHSDADASGDAGRRAAATSPDVASRRTGAPVDQQGHLPLSTADERGAGMAAGETRNRDGFRDDPLIDTEVSGIDAADRSIDATALDGSPDARGVDVIVVGYGRVGREVVRTLTASGPRNIVVIEDRPDMHARLRDVHVRSVCGNAVQADVLLRAGLAGARHLIVAIPNAFEAAEVIRQARHLAPDVRILARAGNTAEVQHLEAHGAHAVVIEKHEIARGLARELYDVA